MSIQELQPDQSQASLVAQTRPIQVTLQCQGVTLIRWVPDTTPLVASPWRTDSSAADAWTQGLVHTIKSINLL